MRIVLKTWLLGLVLAFVGIRQAQAEPVFGGLSLDSGVSYGTGGADPQFFFSFSDPNGDSGYGALNAIDLGGGVFSAFSGQLVVDSGADTGTYGLFLDPNGPNAAYSPSGAFIYDNLLYPSGSPMLDSPGLLFTGYGLEINIFNRGSGLYSFWSWNNVVGYNVFDEQTSFNLTQSPVPGSLTLLGLGLVSFGGATWIRRRKVAS